MKLLKPRNYPGAQDKAFREFQLWVNNLSDIVSPYEYQEGIAQLIENLIAESAMSPDWQYKISSLEKKLDDLMAVIAMAPSHEYEIVILKNKVKELESQLAMSVDHRAEIAALRQELQGIKTVLAMEK